MRVALDTVRDDRRCTSARRERLIRAALVRLVGHHELPELLVGRNRKAHAAWRDTERVAGLWCASAARRGWRIDDRRDGHTRSGRRAHYEPAISKRGLCSSTTD